VQSSIIIGIVVWLLLLTVFFIILLAILLNTSMLVHRGTAGGRVRPSPGDGGRVTAAAAVPGRRASRGQQRDGGVPRRLSTRSFSADPWMSSLAENVWKDYPLETIDDT